jgi:hypothetical protein
MKLARIRRYGAALAALFLVVLGARMLAPYYILKYVNTTLDELDGYTGTVADIDLNIWRGAYEIEGIHIYKEGPKKRTPLLSVDRVDISVEWSALLDGSIVAEIDLYEPKLNFIAEKKKESPAEDRNEKKQAKLAAQGESTWQQQVKDLVPLKINRIGIHDGSIHYRDFHTDPKVNVFVQNFRGDVKNLTNSEDLSESLVATAAFRGLAMRSGKLQIDASIDPYQKAPTFQLEAKLEDLDAKQLNDFLRAYANVDAEAGTISVYTEVASKNQRFKGYVKPLIRDLRILRWKDEEEGFFGKLWEGLVEGATELFENHDKEQVATKIPFSGRIDQPDADVMTTVVYVLRNAFIEALSRGLEGSVDIGDGKLSSADEGE